MSILSVHDLQGIAAYQNKIRVPSGNGLEIEGDLKIPLWTTDTRPASPTSGTIGFNTSTKVTEIYDGTDWLSVGAVPNDGSSAANAASGPDELVTNGVSTDGEYWIKPSGQTTAYKCYVQFGTAGQNWCAVAGMSSTGVRGDANGNSSGLAGFSLNGENTAAASLNGNTITNTNATNFSLPRDWINACSPKGLRVVSGSQDMVALFNRSGSYVTATDIWSYYWAINNYDNIPAANGRNDSASTVNAWLGANVNVYKDSGVTGPNQGYLWSGNHHCGWSTPNPHYHMLHGSTNYSFSASPYNGFCLDGTCWNESGIVFLSF